MQILKIKIWWFQIGVMFSIIEKVLEISLVLWSKDA